MDLFFNEIVEYKISEGIIYSKYKYYFMKFSFKLFMCLCFGGGVIYV